MTRPSASTRNSALAYSARADAFSQLADYGGVSQAYAAGQATASAGRGVELAPDLPETQASWGLALSNSLSRWRNAEPAFEKAIRLDSNYAPAHHWYGAFLVRLGRNQEAIRELSQAVALDAVNLPTSAVLGFMYYFNRDYQIAANQGLKTVDMDRNFRYGYLLLARAYTGLRQFEAARRACERGIALSGNAPVFASASACIFAEEGQSASSLSNRGRPRTAPAQRAHSSALYRDCLRPLGDASKAFEWLRKGWLDGESSILMVRAYPQFDHIRSDPRYAPLLADFHLQ